METFAEAGERIGREGGREGAVVFMVVYFLNLALLSLISQI